ncbi:hypothetical protein CC86DRAFT_145380 [Ophiobolus disseminans]|uniref:Uncharacterized protein n=1 Tax=Ophiobolus disseminans TaxID=1469910 RepID=A0A6A6ZFA6_9PLEO|nr:hypothetical protein CC86DRAFT_145380 [Ophiobolus disseminans]
MQRFTNDKFPMVGVGFKVCFYVLVAHGFAGLHVAAWNLHFPSRLEVILWRTSSLIICGLMVVIFVVESAADWQRRERGKLIRAWLKSGTIADTEGH